MSDILHEVSQERSRQDEKWGEQNHDPFLYLAILGEEVGEANQAALQLRFEGGHADHLRAELIQVAAVAVAMVECLDRDRWRWGGHAQEKSEAVDEEAMRRHFEADAAVTIRSISPKRMAP